MLISKVSLSGDFCYSFLFDSISLAARLLCSFYNAFICSLEDNAFLLQQTCLSWMHFDEKDWIVRWSSFLLLFKWKSEVWSSQSRWWVHQHSNQKCGWNAHGHAGWMKCLSNLGIVHKCFSMVSVTGLNSSIAGLACTASVKTLFHYIFKATWIGHW